MGDHEIHEIHEVGLNGVKRGSCKEVLELRGMVG